MFCYLIIIREWALLELSVHLVPCNQTLRLNSALKKI